MYSKIEQMINDEFFYNTIEILKDLVKIPSVSCNEKALARYIGAYLKKTDAQVIFQTINDNSENVIASIDGCEGGPNIIFAGHLDTVSPLEGWDKDPFNPYEDFDRIYGLGSSDMKAGIAIAMTLAEIFAKNKDNFKGNIMLVFFADEEGYSTGIKKIIEEMGIDADVVYMIEPHYYDAIIGAAGKMLIKVTAKGKASHAAHPEQGINAIEEISRLISNLNKVRRVTHEKIQNQPFVTFNIKGGYESYSVTVPDSCEVIINKHTVPGESVELVLKQLQELKNDLGLKSEFDFKVIEPFYPPYAIDENSKYLYELQKAYKEVLGYELGLEYETGVSDSNCIVGLTGITTINFGPSGGPIHSPNEWVSKNQICNVLKVYAKIICNLMY